VSLLWEYLKQHCRDTVERILGRSLSLSLSLSFSLSIRGRLPLLSRLISLNAPPVTCLHDTRRGVERYPKHGEVTRIPNTMEINDINNFTPRYLHYPHNVIEFSPVNAYGVACTYARSRACPYTCSYAYSGEEGPRGRAPLAPINLHNRDCAINAQTYSFLKNDL